MKAIKWISPNLIEQGTGKVPGKCNPNPFWRIPFFAFVALFSIFGSAETSAACVKASVERTLLCVPRQYLCTPPPGDTLDKTKNNICLTIPLQDLPISPTLKSYETVDIYLETRREGFVKRKANYFDGYKLSHAPTLVLATLESGMNVLSVEPPKLTALTNEILYPENGDPTFFVCGQRWKTRWGSQMEGRCQAHLPWASTTTQPYVELIFSIARKDLQSWKVAETGVRQFLSKYAINNSVVNEK